MPQLMTRFERTGFYPHDRVTVTDLRTGQSFAAVVQSANDRVAVVQTDDGKLMRVSVGFLEHRE